MKQRYSHRTLRLGIATLAVAFGVMSATSQPFAGSAGQDITFVIPIRDSASEINLGSSRFLRRAVKEAEQLGAKAIIVDINTFGGAELRNRKYRYNAQKDHNN